MCSWPSGQWKRLVLIWCVLLQGVEGADTYLGITAAPGRCGTSAPVCKAGITPALGRHGFQNLELRASFTEAGLVSSLG